jgi:hypothetical protein
VLTYTGSDGWFSDPGRRQQAGFARLADGAARTGTSDQSCRPLATLPNTSRPAACWARKGSRSTPCALWATAAYLVTFRRADPLYVLDLSNPADPKTVGELTVAGFSEQLYPLANGLLLGVGHDADDKGVVTGLKLALFDVADPAKPSQRASFVMGGMFSSSAADYSRHGLNLFMRGGVARVALPVQPGAAGADLRPGGWLSGLVRFEVDTAARTMRERPMVGGRKWQRRQQPLERIAACRSRTRSSTWGRASSAPTPGEGPGRAGFSRPGPHSTNGAGSGALSAISQACCTAATAASAAAASAACTRASG